MTQSESIDDWLLSERKKQAASRSQFFCLLNDDLSRYGFKRSGQVFRRKIGSDTQLLDFESHHGAFRLQLGVYFPDLEFIMSNGLDLPEPLSRQRAWKCHVREYLADLVPHMQETNPYDPSDVAMWVNELHRSAIPWLDRAASPSFTGGKSPELRRSLRRMWKERNARG